jgi:anaerobic selenocysteine-containing dehydrogenase
MHARGVRNSAAGMPTGALADEILLQDEHRVRALINHGGNPVAAWPDQLKTLDAMRALDLLVQLDLTVSATAREADYVIAVKHPLEMAGCSLNHEYLSAYAPGYGTTQAWAQYTSAVVEAPEGSDVIEDWEFFYGLAQRMGLALRMTPVSFTGTVRIRPTPLDMVNKPTTDELLALLTAGSRVSLDDVRAADSGAVFAEPAITVAPAQPEWEGRLDAGNARMLADLAAFEVPSPPDAEWPFRLVSRRQINVLNSSGHDIPGQHRGKTYNPAFLHPDDLAALGLSAGELVTLRSARASIPAVVEADRNLRRGLVSMSHSWGGGPETDGEVREGGACTGRLLTDDADYEAYTAMPRMSNIPVTIEPHA